MRECRTYGSVRGVGGNAHPYRDSLGVLQRKKVDTASLQATDPTARKTGRLHYRGDNRAVGLAQEGKNRGLLARRGAAWNCLLNELRCCGFDSNRRPAWLAAL
jgi:hypothetical protein